MSGRNLFFLIENPLFHSISSIDAYVSANKNAIKTNNREELTNFLKTAPDPHKYLFITDIQEPQFYDSYGKQGDGFLFATIIDSNKTSGQILFDYNSVNSLIGIDILNNTSLAPLFLDMLSGKKEFLNAKEITAHDEAEHLSFVLKKTSEKEGILNNIDFIISNKYCKLFGMSSKQYSTSMSIATDELILNGVFDANGRLYGKPRNCDYDLEEHEWIEIDVSLGKTIIAISVRDKFGTLKKEHIAAHINHNDMEQQIHNKQSAGLGLRLTLNISSQMIYNVKNGKQTEVICIMMPERSLQAFKRKPKSLFYREI